MFRLWISSPTCCPCLCLACISAVRKLWNTFATCCEHFCWPVFLQYAHSLLSNLFECFMTIAEGFCAMFLEWAYLYINLNADMPYSLFSRLWYMFLLKFQSEICKEKLTNQERALLSLFCTYVAILQVVNVYQPMWALEHCRISQSRFLDECHMRRLNQSSFVLLTVCIVCFFWVVSLVSVLCVFLIVFCPVFSSMNQREWHCIA